MTATGPAVNPVVYDVFISSPGDVGQERACAIGLIERLNGEFQGRVRLEPVAWEQGTYAAHADFQTQITPSIGCNLVIGIVWAIVGSPLDPTRYARPDGSGYESGTVYEIETALDRRRTGPEPDVVLFRKDAALPVSLDPAAASYAIRQLGLLGDTLKRWLFTTGGEFKAAFNTYATIAAFETKLEQHLRTWLAERGFAAQIRGWTIGSDDDTPYPGLEPYEARHQAVFFGRDQARELCRQQLSEAAARGCAFLLVLGSSGAGKSSLARAGLLPILARPGGAPGVDAWRQAILRPGKRPVLALAETLFAADCLPGLVDGDAPDPTAWAATVMGRPESAAGSVAAALRRAGEAANKRICLLLLADQLEEALDAAEPERDAFCAALSALARSGVCWVIATARADRYSGLQAIPALLALKRDGAAHDLAAPDGDDIEAIIRGPARAAGLSFERGADGSDLASLLRRDMDGADALPLLQMALAQLFLARDPATGLLTFAAYQAIGGLRGAIERQAEAVFARAGPAAQAELPAILLELASGIADAGQVTSRPVAMHDLAATTARASLVGTLVDGRLLLTEQRTDEAGRAEAWVRVAHEALLRNWDQAAKILAPEHLRAKPRLEDALRDWVGRGRARAELLRGTLLDAGAELLSTYGAALPSPLAAFIRQSQSHARRRRLLAIGIVSTVAAVFAGLAFVSFDAARRSEASRFVAEANFNVALDATSNMIVDMAGGLRNRTGVPVQLVEQVLDLSLGSLDRLAARSPDDARLLGLRSRAQSEFADTFIALGDTERGQRAADEALAIARRLADTRPADVAAQQTLAGRERAVAQLLATRGDVAGALSQALTSRDRIRALLARNQGHATLKHGVVLAELLVADLAKSQDRFGLAATAYQQAYDSCAELIKANAADDDARTNQTLALEGLAAMDERANQLSRARARLQEALALRQQLADQHPDNTMLLDNLAVSQENLARLALGRSDMAGARGFLQAAKAITERLLAADPRNTKWLSHDNSVRSQLEFVALYDADTGSDIDALRATVEQRRVLIQKDPRNVGWQSAYARAQAALGNALAMAGDVQRGLEALNGSIATWTLLLGRDPGNREYLGGVCVSGSTAGGLKIAKGFVREGAVLLDASRSQCLEVANAGDGPAVGGGGPANLGLGVNDYGRALVAFDSNQVDQGVDAMKSAVDRMSAIPATDATALIGFSLAAAYGSFLGDVLLELDRPSEAKAAYAAAIQQAARIGAVGERTLPVTVALAKSEIGLGRLLAAEGRPEEALDSLRHGLARIGDSKKAGGVAFASIRADGNLLLADMLEKAGDLAGATRAMRARVDALTPAPADPVADDEAVETLASSHYRLANLLDRQSDPNGALAEFLIDLELRDRLSKQHPEEKRYASNVLISQNRTVGVMLAADKPQDAVTLGRQTVVNAEELMRSSDDPVIRRRLLISHEQLANALRAVGDFRAAAAESAAAADGWSLLVTGSGDELSFCQSVFNNAWWTAEAFRRQGTRERASAWLDRAYAAATVIDTRFPQTAEKRDNHSALSALRTGIEQLMQPKP